MLSKENYGRPTCPDIKINPKKWGYDDGKLDPQACEKDGNWYYNYPARLKESEYTGLTIPTIEKLMEELKNPEVRDSIKYLGFRNADVGEFHLVGDYAYLASSSPKGDGDVHCAILRRGYADAGRVWFNHERGMSLRFLSDKSVSSTLSPISEIIQKLQELKTTK